MGARRGRHALLASQPAAHFTVAALTMHSLPRMQCTNKRYLPASRENVNARQMVVGSEGHPPDLQPGLQALFSRRQPML